MECKCSLVHSIQIRDIKVDLNQFFQMQVLLLGWFFFMKLLPPTWRWGREKVRTDLDASGRYFASLLSKHECFQLCLNKPKLQLCKIKHNNNVAFSSLSDASQIFSCCDPFKRSIIIISALQNVGRGCQDCEKISCLKLPTEFLAEIRFEPRTVL